MEKNTWCGLKPGDHVLYVIRKDGTKTKSEVSPYGLLNIPLAFYFSSFGFPKDGPVVHELVYDLRKKLSRFSKADSREKGEVEKLLEMLSSNDTKEIFVEIT